MRKMENRQVNELSEAALIYIKNGIPVFPLQPRGKTPLTPHGFKDATTNENQIREWWSQWPDGNIGRPTGQASGALVLDIDSQDAYRKVREIVSFGEDPTVKTSANRYQIYYKHDGRDFRNRTGIIPGLDFRGNGGYVVVPPSIHETGHVYEWVTPLRDDTLRFIPPDLEKLLLGRKSSANQEHFDSSTVWEGIPEGQRDDTLFRYALVVLEQKTILDMK